MDVESTLTSQYHNILLLKEEFWALKSHLHWATLGDRNTSFFHLSTMCKRHHNKIWCLKNSLGSWSQSLEELKSIIQNHFTDLYTIGLTTFTPFAPQPDYLHTLSLATRDSLSENVSKSDIFKAIHSFNPLKSPGPDGLHPIFFQKYCDIIGDSVTAFIQGIFKLKKMPPELNSTLICLIPKVSNPESIDQFRPIGLYNTLYKTVTKILVTRLKPLISDLVHPFQASFIPGRKATDNVILV